MGALGAAWTLTASGTATIVLAIVSGMLWTRRQAPASPHRAHLPIPDRCTITPDFGDSMKLLTNVFDMWVFTRAGAEPRYLLLHTSQEKADMFFGGGRFWQIPGAFLDEDEQVPDVLDRPLDELGLRASAVWAIEHVYPIFNRRFNDVQLIPVFAAEVPGPAEPQLTWEHSEAGWYTAAECNERLIFRGLTEGLHWLRRYVTEADTPAQVFRLR